MRSFELDRVTLLPGPFAERQALTADYIKNFDIDRLMHNFRVNAGISSNAEPLGGWEAPWCQLRGHFTGHFLASCAKFAYGTGDIEIAKKADDIVDIMAECAREDGYLSAFEEHQLNVLEQNENTGVWAPYYTLHKIINGLVCCGRYLKNGKAVKLAEDLAIYIYKRFEKLSYWKIDNILRPTKINPVNEFGGIGDSLYGLWELTGNDRILSLAKLFDRDYFLGKLSKGEDILVDLHANTHLPLIIGALHRYTITGEEEYKTAALRFYEFLSKRTFANGNNSSKAAHPIKGGVSDNSEHWGCGHLTEADITGGESESCCGHNTETILSYLLNLDPENTLTYLNHLENIKYNSVLNCASSVTGLSQYHQPLGTDKTKKFSSHYDDFWCCTASGVEAMSELQRNIWFYDGEMILLNMFIPSKLTAGAGLSLTLNTDYPRSSGVTITVYADMPHSLRLAFKKGQITELCINGTSYPLTDGGAYDILSCTVNYGDIIAFTVDSEIKQIPFYENSSVYHVMYGNILLAKTEGEHSFGDPIKNMGDGTFRSEKAVFKPLYDIEKEKYTVYINSNTGTTAKDGSEAYQS